VRPGKTWTKSKDDFSDSFLAAEFVVVSTTWGSCGHCDRFGSNIIF